MAEVPTGYMCAVTIMEGGKGLPQNREDMEEHSLTVEEVRVEEPSPHHLPWRTFHLETTV